MATEDRDRHFDQALARHLRAENAPSSAGSQGFTSAGDCLDTETLAAYHERSLLPEEMNSCKEHIVSCAHCQAVLAQLELTDEIPFEAAEEELVESSLPASRAAAAAPVLERPASPEGVARKARRLQLLRGASWQWLTATGGLAAALLVWVALHENQSLPIKNMESPKVAENRAPAPAPASGAANSRTTPQDLTSAKPSPALTASGSVTTGAGAGNGRREDAVASKQRQSLGDAVRSHENALDDKDLALKKNAARDGALRRLSPGISADGLNPSTEVTVTAQSPSVQNEKKEQFDAGKQDSNGLAQNQLQSQANYSQNYAQQKVGGPSPLNQATPPPKSRASTATDVAAPSSAATAKRSASSPQPAPTPQAVATDGIASNYSSSALEMVSVTNPRLIPVAGTNSLWRAGRSGLIDFSKDGGSSWAHQNSGVLTDLLTGSAPSNQVCWIVGRVGAIVLTTDGGSNWKLIKSPLTEDLGGVQAPDALHATIWNARGTKRIQTSDGGQTWFVVPNP